MPDKPDFAQVILQRFCDQAPLAVMAQQALTHLLAPAALDAVFAAHARNQYTQTLTFSATVALMGEVVLTFQPSLRRAHAAHAADLGVSLQAVYDKVAGVEPQVCAALVAASAARAGAVLEALGAPTADPLPGYRVRIADATYFAATHRRIKKLRQLSAGPLPGFGLVIYDPARELPVALFPCEDAYVQERTIARDVLALATAGDCWLGDRAFCTAGFLAGLATRGAAFLVRAHAKVPITVVGPRVHVGTSATGEVYEEPADLTQPDGTALRVRRLIVPLAQPTRDGDRELVLVTTVPAAAADAVRLADLYHTRWRIESAFQRLTSLLRSEVDTLGYPRAALFGFALGLVAYASVSVLEAALAAAHGASVRDTLSWYEVATELQTTHAGLTIAVPEAVWAPYQTMRAAEVAAALLSLARRVRIDRYRMAHPRSKRRTSAAPKTARTRFRGRPHVSTYRLLLDLPQRTSPKRGKR